MVILSQSHSIPTRTNPKSMYGREMWAIQWLNGRYRLTMPSPSGSIAVRGNRRMFSAAAGTGTTTASAVSALPCDSATMPVTVADDPRRAALYGLMLSTGMRLGEVRAVT